MITCRSPLALGASGFRRKVRTLPPPLPLRLPEKFRRARGRVGVGIGDVILLRRWKASGLELSFLVSFSSEVSALASLFERKLSVDEIRLDLEGKKRSSDLRVLVDF